MVYDYDLIVIGGGMSGYTLAKDAASIGVKVLLVEEKMLGGSGLFYGGVPFAALARASQGVFRCSHAEEYGLSSMRQNVNWEQVKKRVQEVQESVFNNYDPQELRNIGCDVVFGIASFVDQYHINIAVNDDMKAYQPAGFDLSVKQMKVAGKKIVIATGSMPIIPEIKGLDEHGFVVPQQMYEMDLLPASIALLGTNPRRIEIAQVLARLGIKVTLFTEDRVVLPNEDIEMNDRIEVLLEKSGVKIMKNVRIQEIRMTPSGHKQVVYSEAGLAHNTDVHEIMVSYGQSPNIESLQLKNVELEVNENGIVVDKKLQTSNKRIFAIGDVNGEDVSHPHKALYEAEFLFHTQCLYQPMKRDYRLQGSVLFLDPAFARIGYNAFDLNVKKIKYDTVEMKLDRLERSIADNSTDGLIRVFVSKEKKILGVQILSPRADDLIREWQLILQKGLSIKDIAHTPYFMSTYGALSQKVAKRYMHDIAYSKQFKKILSLLFGYRGR